MNNELVNCLYRGFKFVKLMKVSRLIVVFCFYSIGSCRSKLGMGSKWWRGALMEGREKDTGEEIGFDTLYA